MTQTLDQLTTDPKITLLLYGATGTGKTTLLAKAAEFDEFAPLEFLDFDLRLDGLVRTLPNDLLRRIRFTSYRDSSIPGEAYDRVFARIRELEAIAGKPEAPKTIVLDSLSFLDKAFVSMTVYLDAQKGHKDGSAKDRYGELIASQDHYGPAMQHIERFIQRLTGLKQKGYNVFVTAHERERVDPVTHLPIVGAQVTGKIFPGRLPGYFNEYWRTAVEVNPIGGSISYFIRPRRTVGIDARTSFGFLSETELQDTIWQKIVTQLRAKKEKGGISS